MERHALRRDLARLRLADVVEQRGEAERSGRLGLAPLDHGVRMAKHVLVPVHRILLEAERRQLRQELIRQAGLDEQLETRRRPGAVQQLHELVGDPLRAHDREALAHATDRLHDPRRRRDLQLGHEPGGTQHPQRIVGERHLGFQRRVERLRGEVAYPAERVDERAARHSDRHRVDREVAAREIGLDVLGERHRGLAMGLVVHVLAERGHLERAPVLARAHRPELHPYQVDPIGPRAHHPRRLVRRRVGAEVQIGLGALGSSHHQIADRPTHELRFA